MTLPWWLQGFYLFTTIFGVGVTAVDMLGILGGGHEHGAGDHGDHGGAGHGDAQHGAHAPLLSMLGYLRMGVDFALAFGPLGLIAEAAGAGVLGSLAWAVPGGMTAALLARAFFRFQQQDVDSSVRDEELLFERARVMVPMSSTTMGKARLKLGQSVVERYALAEDKGDAFRPTGLCGNNVFEPSGVLLRRAIMAEKREDFPVTAAHYDDQADILPSHSPRTDQPRSRRYPAGDRQPRCPPYLSYPGISGQ